MAPHPTSLPDAAGSTPRLAVYLNLGNLVDLPEDSVGPRGDNQAVLEAVRAAGFEGVQGGDADAANAAGMPYAGGGRIDRPGDALPLAQREQDQGASAITVHVGSGLEDDEQIDALIDDVLAAEAATGLPVLVETHRATVTQDPWRTVQLVRRRPEVRFNFDFSHWYTGLEWPYGDMDAKQRFIAPVLERVRFMHGRIGNPSHMQVDIGATLAEALQRPFVQHFEKIWTAAMVSFCRTASPGQTLIFAPELLPPAGYYARQFPGPDGQLREETDRWTQALLLGELARHCFAQAQAAARR
jgi:hypothetical protein